MGAVSFLRDLLRDQSGMYAATPFKVLILLGVASSGAWGKPFDSHHPLLFFPVNSAFAGFLCTLRFDQHSFIKQIPC